MEKEQLIELRQELHEMKFEEWSTDLKLSALLILELREVKNLLALKRGKEK